MHILLIYDKIGKSIVDYTPCNTVPFGFKLLQDRYAKPEADFIRRNINDYDIYSIDGLNSDLSIQGEPITVNFCSQLKNVIDAQIKL